MKKLFLEKIRLSAYFWFFLIVFTVLVFIVPRQKYGSAALALFSVNSFLYGFYIAPILSGQKARVEDLHRITRSEANAIFAMAISLVSYPTELRNKLQQMLIDYMKSIVRQKKSSGGEIEYEELISFCIKYKGEQKKQVMGLLDKLVSNQQNRTNFSMQMHNPVFSNEWSIMLVLFGITIGFVITLDAGSSAAYRLLAACWPPA